MRLLPSVVTSLAIVCLILLLAASQPNSALESRTKLLQSDSLQQQVPVTKVEKALEQDVEVSSDFYFDSVEISGVTQNIPLTQLPNLWLDFNDNDALQSSLKENPSKIFVYYRKFSSSYESAIVSIGFSTLEMKSQVSKTDIPTTPFSVLLSKDKYDNAQLNKAWDKIDYRRNVLAVVEVHHLNTDSSINNSEIFISYK